MAERQRANINPDLLVWARKSVGMSMRIAAARLQIDPEKLSSWESGDNKPTIKQLQKCCTVYRRPLAALFFAKPPSVPSGLHDFRHRSHEDEEAKGYLLQFEIRRARQARKRYLEITDSREDESVRLRTRMGADTERVSSQVRDYLNVTNTLQMSWSDSSKALRAWIEVIESHAVLVLQCSHIPSDVMRGFTVYYPTIPVIMLNGSEAPNGRIFTLLHEFAHILLRRTGVCDTVEYRGATSSNQNTERFCNRLSAATLVPRDNFLSEFVSYQTDSIENWVDNILPDAAKRYKVSTQVILGRLHDLKKIDSDFYFRRIKEIIKQGKKSEESKSSAEQLKIYYPLKVRNLGYKYTQTVVAALHGGALSTLEACRYLDVKLKNIAGIEKQVIGGK